MTVKRTIHRSSADSADVAEEHARATQGLSHQLQALLALESRLGRRSIGDYVTYLRSPWRIFWSNLIAGLSYGIGFVLGGSILIALLLILLAWLAQIPVAGDYFQWMAETIRHPFR